MRLTDWFLIFILIFGLIIGKYDKKYKIYYPEENFRRPNPERFIKKERIVPNVPTQNVLWYEETKNWPNITPHIKEIEIEKPFYNKKVIIQAKKKVKPVTGSSFSISRKGIWLTAKHVVEDCRKIGIQIKKDQMLMVSKLITHPNADIAILFTNRAPKGLLISKDEKIQNSFNIGFPKGLPGVLQSKFLGTTTVMHTRIGRRDIRYREHVDVWVQLSRLPNFSGSIAGISGGATLNKNGEIIGVVQAENVRRKLILTAKKSTIKNMLRIGNIDLAQSTNNYKKEKITKYTYPKRAQNLIINNKIAKVYCEVI